MHLSKTSRINGSLVQKKRYISPNIHPVISQEEIIRIFTSDSINYKALRMKEPAISSAPYSSQAVLNLKIPNVVECSWCYIRSLNIIVTWSFSYLRLWQL